MPFILFIVVAGAFLVYAYLRNRKMNTEGIRTDAVVSRIERNESVDDEGVSYRFFVSYKDEEGKMQEALIVNRLNEKFEKGQTVKIAYLPEKKEQAVVIE